MITIKKALAVSVFFIGFQVASAQTGTSSQNGKNIEVNGVGNTKTYSSDGGNAVIAGVENVITINGYITRLTVSGSGNKVYADKVSRIIIEGTDNKVFYNTAPTKTGKPAVSVTGVANSVQKR
ncbi:DUF3060 domain-containing protein [Chryseobacterium sp. JJR-5R]|uniref:DUF3060 domain-containing protein n=1 Tax=Chryseobacterium sp. JJR-5R TaxID=3093923 RepID=UPI002A747AC7|nr:DUF3060 domain-containing protein [Chryseobacterium sp. JJR-5R]WPO84006.1 DUF3060 domain-containing protein [Chryseobacterium sp. JJR-5R]